MGLFKLFRKVTGRGYVSPEKESYLRLSAKGYNPGGIIDVGAYTGGWTVLAREVFPNAPILMVEAQAEKIPELNKVAALLPNVRVEHALLAASPDGERTFHVMETGSSIFPEQSNVPREEVLMRTRTLDELSAGFSGPLFLKVDVQGAELEVLDGAVQTLENCDLVQLEVGLLPYNLGSPTFLEKIQYMDRRGFVPLEVCGLNRPNGTDLADINIVFARKDSPLRCRWFAFS